MRIELYADGAAGGPGVRQEMKRVRQVGGPEGGILYSGVVPAARPPGDYTARAVPSLDGVAVPLEEARIVWQH